MDSILTDSDDQLVREIQDNEIGKVQHLIHETIDISYSPVYPLQAINYFKKYHSLERILDRQSKGSVLVSIVDSDIIGTGSFLNGEILGVFVNPDFQQRGHGKSLMFAIEKIARSKGYSKVFLSVSLPSKQFYENLDYTIFEECSLSVGNGEYLDYWKAMKQLI